MNDETLVPVFMPPLAYMLGHHERQKGSPLTEQEVLAIRDSSVAMMMRQSIAEQMAQKRGYRDVDPKCCWEEWQDMRKSCEGRCSERPLRRPFWHRGNS